MDQELNRIWKRLIVQLFSIYMALLICLVGALVVINKLHIQSLAESVTVATRDALMIGDNRSAMAVLQRYIGHDFFTIKYVDQNAKEIFRLDNSKNKQLRSVGYDVLTLAYRVNLLPNLNGAIRSGYLEFRYGIMTFVPYAIGLWFVFLFASVPLAKRYWRHLSQQYSVALMMREAKSIETISKQVAHDIRSPLMALNMALCSLVDIPDEHKMVISNAIGRIRGISQDLLDKAKYRNSTDANESAGRDKSSDYDLLAMIEGLLKEKQLEYRYRSGIQLLLDSKEAGSIFVRHNRSDLARVLSNLLNNSIEAIGNVGRVIIGVRLFPKEIGIFVSDNGQGVDPEILSRLGKIQISYGKTDSTSGTGLGLFHANKTIVALGGRLTVQSRVGEGTMVTITLPRDLDSTI